MNQRELKIMEEQTCLQRISEEKIEYKKEDYRLEINKVTQKNCCKSE